MTSLPVSEAEFKIPAGTGGRSVSQQLSPLTGFRGIAAYTVLIAHALDLALSYGGVQPFHAISSRLAYFGMSLFFVLSGFVIEYNYHAAFANEPFGRALYQFFVARFARIYPLYIITLLPALAYIPSIYFGHEVLANIAYLTLTQSWFNLEMAVFPPDWSISTEWFFYFAFVPLTLLVIRWPLVTLAAVGIAAVAALEAMFVLFPNNLLALVEQCCVHDAKVSASAWGWIVYFSPYVRLPEFIMGMLAAKAYATMSERRPSPRVANIVIGVCLAWCAALIGLSALSTVPFIGLLTSNFIFAPALAPLLLFCCLHDGVVSRTLSSRPLMFAGEISYSVYIWSWSALGLLGPLYVSAAPSALAYFNSGVKIALCLGYTTIFAYGSYLLIEAPARRFIRAKLIAGSTAASAAARRAAVAAPGSA
jgi:peptidoglycan/LPS O-acetylase OafA/YrhL